MENKIKQEGDGMKRKIRTIREGNAFYEIDEECLEKLQRKKEVSYRQGQRKETDKSEANKERG